MAGNVIQISDDAHFDRELANAGTKLVVVDFFATWYPHHTKPLGPGVNPEYRFTVECENPSDSRTFSEMFISMGPDLVPADLTTPNHLSPCEPQSMDSPLSVKIKCGPCHRVAPQFVLYSTKYPKAVFLKVDVDQCADTAQGQGVSAMPTFIFYRNKVKIDMLRGADPAALEEKIKKWYGDAADGDDDADEVTVKGHMDLSSFYMKSNCECLNEADDHPMAHCLTPKGGYLESDCDEQLILSLEFNQAVRLHSLKLYGPPDKGPKTVKIFINQPKSLDFDSADSMAATQNLDLTEKDVKEGTLIPLRFVKFQNVSNVTLFIKDNQSGDEVTQLDYLGFIGSPVSTTNMSDFKRVAGKKGESH